VWLIYKGKEIMRSILLSRSCALSLLSTLTFRGEAIVEFDSTFLAKRTVARLSRISSFPFSVLETEEGFLVFRRLEVLF